VLRRRPQQAEERRAEEKAADQLTHDRRLADALREFAHQPPDQKQQRKLGDEQRLRSTARTALRGERWNGFDRGCRAEQRENGN
jgi:hypothetical protein